MGIRSPSLRSSLMQQLPETESGQQSGAKHQRVHKETYQRLNLTLTRLAMLEPATISVSPELAIEQ